MIMGHNLISTHGGSQRHPTSWIPANAPKLLRVDAGMAKERRGDTHPDRYFLPP